ncbi:MAG: amino acid adenylation domain-containing protein, partial [Planctomycetaceae bacterium]|nr:amino acid adenylation domain-containing protein [Planctomycetaceae bacterium]
APSAAVHPAPDAETARRIAEALGSGAEIFPATATQRMLLMHHAMDGSSSYAITARWRMARIDEKEFAARVQTLFDRHGMLSAAFFRDELGKEWLGIPARRPARYRFTDVSGQTVTNRMGEPDAGAERDDQGLDPFSDPLFSITVVRHAADSHELVMRYHHTILDGWSIGILLNELFSPERPVGTPPGFSAYSAWLESGGPGAAAADVSWWETALQGATPAPEPPGRRRESAGPPIHATVTVLDAGAADRCGRAAAAITVTPAAYFLTLWGILLSRCDESDTDPYFGVVVSGRPPLPGMENLVGMCAQVVPLRLPLDRADNNIAFASLAMAVQQNLQDAMEHRLVPPALVRTLPRHLFAFDNTAAVAADTVLPEPVESRGDDGYDLVLAFSEAGTGYFRYNAAAYDPAWIRVAAGHFATLAAAAAENPDAAAAELPMASADEMHRVTNSFARGPALPQGDTVVRRFRAAALRAPHSPAITFENTTITYGTLDARSDALAGTLAKAGAGKGMVVAAALPRSPEAGIAFLAILKAGAIYLPLDPAWPTARMDEILDDAGAAIIVAPAGLTIHHHAVRIDPFSAGDSAPAPPSPIAPEKRDAAYLLYTSGTTGRPKGAILDHAALAALVAWTAEELGVDAADRILHYIAFTFDPSVWLFASAFSLGASLHIAGDNLRLEPDAIVRYINDCSLTTAVFPARIAGGIVARGTDMPTLRLLCMGGETPGRIPPCPFRVLNLYGPTEACVNATFAPLHPDRSERIIGRPVANMRAYVVLDSGRPAPIGVAGELVLSGPQLARGYHNRPDETAAAFRPNPFVTGPEGDGDYARIYRTGDRVRWLPDGNLEYLGRRDGQVKVRGQRVEVGEIETVLARTDGVGEARVIPASDPAGGTRLDAFYIADGDPAAAPDEILRRLATLLPSHMIPATLTRVEAWPLTANGKLDPARLPRPEPARRDVAGGPPLTRAERDVARVWSELLGVEAIGRDDDFFALGGHSLLVFSMLGRLPRRYRGEAGTLFENPVLRDFAAHLRVVASEETADRTVETVTIPAAYREAVEAAGKTGPGEAIEWRHILLTGATGFLGAHLLQEYMGTTGTRFILPVRGNEPLARLRETLAFYFDRDAAEAIAASSRLRVVPVDLADRNAADILARLGRIDCILHAAAATGHYGTYPNSHAVNAAATAALVRLAEESGAFFAHVSTVGAVNSALVTELDRDPGPPHINNYLRTKQLAETEIFSAMERGLAATVLRIGNIALNSQTLRSPRTFSHNALIRLTRLVALTGVYADTVPPVRYAFVDQTARAIRLLLERPAFTGAVHHVDNPYGVEYGDVFALAGRPRPRVVPTGDLRRILERLAAGSDPFLADVAREYLGRVRQHESEVAAGERVTATVLCDLTVARLKRIGFSWKKLSPGLAEEIVRNALKIS